MNHIQYIWMAAGAVLLLLFLAPLFTNGIVNIGTVTGVVISGLFLFYGCFMKDIHEKMKLAMQNTAGKVFVWAAAAAVMIVLLVAAIETVGMVRAACRRPPENTTAIVLGCSVKGTKPSRILQERLDATFRYLTENEDAVAVLSGGQGEDEMMSEAQCMYEYLTAKGIDGRRLLLEEQSANTRENLSFSKEILKERGLGITVTIITSEFHEYRAIDMAEKLGLESYSTPAHTFFVYFPTYYVRELYGILYYKMRS